jgi:hypothetical protein
MNVSALSAPLQAEHLPADDGSSPDYVSIIGLCTDADDLLMVVVVDATGAIYIAPANTVIVTDPAMR